MNRAEHIAALRAASGAPAGGDRLQLAEWTDGCWYKLLDHTRSRPFRASEVVIQRDATDRVLHFVVALDRKSTRLNSSHSQISYAVFCLKKKNKKDTPPGPRNPQRPRPTSRH